MGHLSTPAKQERPVLGNKKCIRVLDTLLMISPRTSISNNFYKTCQDNKIPITFHCSAGGMQIPDYFNFQRYVNNMAREEYDLKESDDFFADLYASPSNWKMC